MLITTRDWDVSKEDGSMWRLRVNNNVLHLPMNTSVQVQRINECDGLIDRFLTYIPYLKDGDIISIEV